ncbi:hypothetical protein DXG01_009909 [Tephrocybe rancida]|nr:hypothetical protein DXG01_009909 [Tephrocybe rancida]
MHLTRWSSPNNIASPVKKRQRLSSPTYDGQYGDPSQADLDALDELEAHFSQSPQKSSSQVGGHAQNHSSDDATSRRPNILELADDPENPFTARFNKVSSFKTASSLASTSTFTSASAFSSSSTLPIAGLSKASTIAANSANPSREFYRSPSPEEPPSQDYDAWFQPAGAIPPISFQAASSNLPTLETPTVVGFAKASNRGVIAPSSVALAKARAKMQEIWREPDSPAVGYASTQLPASSTEDTDNGFKSASSIRSKNSPRRPILQSVVNSLDSPGFGSPSTPTLGGFSRQSTKPQFAMTPTELFISKNSKPFKSPLLSKKPPTPGGMEAPRLKETPGSHFCGFTPARSQHPLALAPITAQFSSAEASTSFPSIATPARHPKAPAPGSIMRKALPTTFVTPFKPGMEPGQPSRLKLEEALKASPLTQPSSSVKRKADWLTTERPGDKAGRAAWTGVFNLTMYYSFHTPAATPLLPLTSTPPVMLGPQQAFTSLLENGCTLATQAWVDNHWGLILWKLAGMVGLDPQRESIPDQKRWCWSEVMRQMFYRYERELNRGKRPPLRLVTTRDAPAAYPMILCVSDISWNSPVHPDEGAPPEPHPELEVTDGWYRLRARIDAPMARAVRRGHIRIGRKIGVAGAYLSSEKKDPSEALDAYNSVKLVLSGNSSHMVPWHAKLGFNPGPCISTLHSLTPDGGTVAAMDFVVVKTHPIAYVELVPTEGGLHHEGPMNATDEAAAHEKWKKRWEHEMSKLHAEYEKKWDRYEGYLDRLERRAGAEEFRPSQDGKLAPQICRNVSDICFPDFPLDIIENIYNELEDPIEAPNVLAGLGRNECGSLAHFIRDRLQKDKAHAAEDMENELQHTCPPRNVKNFRIIVVQDARTRKHAGNRKALLNVWDVLNLSFSESASPGSFEVGQRFMVTNLKPTHQKSWMGHEPDAEVYLCTGQHSRWTPMKA